MPSRRDIGSILMGTPACWSRDGPTDTLFVEQVRVPAGPHDPFVFETGRLLRVPWRAPEGSVSVSKMIQKTILEPWRLVPGHG